MWWSVPMILLLYCVLAVTLRTSDAKEWSKNCVYMHASNNGPCNPVDALQLVTYNLVRGHPNCTNIIERKQICLGCKYYNNRKWGPCTNGIRSKKEILLPGSKSHCPAERTLTKNCRKGKKKTLPTKSDEECNYRKRGRKWGRCKNGEQKKRLKLIRKKSHRSCPRYRILTRPCPAV